MGNKRSLGAVLVAATAFAPFHASAQVNPSFSNVVNQPLSSSLRWGGGAGIFLLQKKYGLTDPAWINVLTTSNRNFTVAREATSALYRLQSDSTNTVLPYTALLSGANETPATGSTATGIAAFSLEGSNLNYYVSFSGLTGPATAGHIHASATPTNSSSVMIGFTVPAATSGILSGKFTLTQDQITNIVNGLAYVNIHTLANPNAEIRGQIVPLRMVVAMDGASEVPAVASAASGSAILTFIGNQMFYDISYTNLSANATAAHIHGPATPATPTGSAGVLVGFTAPSGTSGNLSGSVVLTPAQLAFILSGQTFVNIHTGSNPGGELRGQVWPLQFRVFLNGAGEIPAVSTAGTGTGLLTVISNRMSYSFTFANLSTTASLAHIHGPGSPSTPSAGVLIGFSPPAAASGTFSGTATLSSLQLFYLINGMTYANIHTGNNPGGEIRGHDYPAN